MKNLSEAQVIELHSMLIEATGGLNGVRDNDLLSAALLGPFQLFGGEELYPSIQEKAARLAFNLIQYHSFIDGNKRIGVLVMLVFLEINGVSIDASDEAVIELGIGVASGILTYEQIVEWIFLHE